MTHTQKVDEVWELYTTTSWGITCYDIFTRAWKYRWWKIYNSDKQYVILSWKCELTIEVKGKDMKSTITPENGVFLLEANTPHIFYFPEDTRLIEWFSQDTQYEDFERYRAMKK